MTASAVASLFQGPALKEMKRPAVAGRVAVHALGRAKRERGSKTLACAYVLCSNASVMKKTICSMCLATFGEDHAL
ncbi:hypothetical protein LYZ85_03640 [Xanthomonas hortorum pv. vitians]|nr:hypothetical protein [Xanthomonas hortorum]MCE4508859.1 hypothetical protein [Xanthomonas hortorum pv. vitians]MCE4548876.1 hypothetical protein [Xanthomonas hortorum pv. vitians]